MTRPTPTSGYLLSNEAGRPFVVSTMRQYFDDTKGRNAHDSTKKYHQILRPANLANEQIARNSDVQFSDTDAQREKGNAGAE